MNFNKFDQLGEKLYFTLDDVCAIFGVARASARVACSRYVRNGLFIRVKNDFYVLKRNLKNISREDLLRLANFAQTPSYVSFLTALAYHDITTQMVRGVVDSACVKRSVEYDINGNQFNFYRLKQGLYSGFEKINNIFIAMPEKALLDSFYFISMGKYSLDMDALDMSKINNRKLKNMLKIFPQKTKELVKKICKI